MYYSSGCVAVCGCGGGWFALVSSSTRQLSIQSLWDAYSDFGMMLIVVVIIVMLLMLTTRMAARATGERPMGEWVADR